MSCRIQGHGEVIHRSDAMGDSYCPDCRSRHYRRYVLQPGRGLRLVAAEALTRGGTCQFMLVYGEVADRCRSRFEDGKLEWHHRDPDDKIATISALANGSNMDVLVAELVKCDLLCWWHHRKCVQGSPPDPSRWAIAPAHMDLVA